MAIVKASMFSRQRCGFFDWVIRRVPAQRELLLAIEPTAEARRRGGAQRKSRRKARGLPGFEFPGLEGPEAIDLLLLPLISALLRVSAPPRSVRLRSTWASVDPLQAPDATERVERPEDRQGLALDHLARHEGRVVRGHAPRLVAAEPVLLA